MPAAEFDALNPRDVGDLLTVYDEHERQLDYRAGVVASIIANVHAGKDAEPYGPWSFFPSLEVMRPGPASDEEVEAKLLAIFPPKPPGV